MAILPHACAMCARDIKVYCGSYGVRTFSNSRNSLISTSVVLYLEVGYQNRTDVRKLANTLHTAFI